MKSLNDTRLEHYERKYSTQSLPISPYFYRQFKYLINNYAKSYSKTPSQWRLIDLGGGTGEFSKAISEIGFNVTCFDFSEAAIEKASSLGIETIQGDFYTHPFMPKYHLALAKGFSCLNTDSPEEFKKTVNQIDNCLISGGIGLYWGHTDLTGQWTSSKWYNFSVQDLDTFFGKEKYVILQAPRYQALFPHVINLWISKLLCRMGHLPLSKSARLLAKLTEKVDI